MIAFFNISTKLILLIFIFTIENKCFTQNIQNDLALIKKIKYLPASNDNFRNTKSINNKEPIKYKNKHFFSRYNPISKSATILMLFYQHVISVQFSRHCLYERTCSNFSKNAIEEFGLLKGVFLSADRLMRCNFAAIQDVPACNFNSEGYVMDEPEIYHTKRK